MVPRQTKYVNGAHCNPGASGFALHLNNEDRAADDSGNEARKEVSSAIPESPRAQAAAHFRERLS